MIHQQRKNSTHTSQKMLHTWQQCHCYHTLLARALTSGRASMMNSLWDWAFASIINWMYFSSSLLRRPPTPTIGWLERVIVAWLSGCIHDRTYSERHVCKLHAIHSRENVRQSHQKTKCRWQAGWRMSAPRHMQAQTDKMKPQCLQPHLLDRWRINIYHHWRNHWCVRFTAYITLVTTCQCCLCHFLQPVSLVYQDFIHFICWTCNIFYFTPTKFTQVCIAK